MNTPLPPGVPPEYFAAITAALFTFGAILKHALPRLPNGAIPAILLALALAGFIALAETVTPPGIVSAFVSAVTAVGSHQLLKQSTKLDL